MTIGKQPLQSTTMQLMLPEWKLDQEEAAMVEYLKKGSHPSSSLMSQIPWVTSPRKSLGFQQDRLYRAMSERPRPHSDLNNRKLMFYLLLGNIFPTFLPPRYHSMNPKVLRRMATDDQYWENVPKFLLQSQLFGQSYHNLISKQLMTDTKTHEEFMEELFCPFFNTTGCKAISPDQCESAGEFLLEPWVLLQLPFQPSMLHQWAVALLAETLRFQKETVTIFTIGVPQKLWDEMLLLKKMLKRLMEGALTLLSIFCKFPRLDRENICKRLRRVRQKLLRTITEVTPIVEFILSEKCRNVISGIKQAAWSSKRYHNLHSTETDVDLGYYHIWYNPAFFWAQNQMPKKLFSDRKFQDQHKQFLQKLRFNMLMLHPEASGDLVQKFVQEQIIGKGVLVGVSDAEILAVAAKAPGKLQFPCYDYFTNIKGIFGNTALEETFCGVAYNITSLYADLKIEEDTAQTARTLIQLLGSKEFGSKKVHYREAQCQQDAFTDFKYTLTKVLANREWTYEKVLERTRNTFTVPIANRVAPFLKIGTEKVANIFQARIKTLVLNMLKRQFETSSGPQPMLWYPECATVQYLLPCFVATFLKMQHDSSASRAQLKNWMLLVHELLLSYEQNPYEQSFTEQWKQPYLYERRKTLGQDVVHLRTIFLQCVNNKFSSTRVLPRVVECFKNLVPTGNGDEVLFDWTVQMFMLTTRLKTCVQTLGWYKEPLTKTLDHVWSGCSFTANNELGMLYQLCRSKLDENLKMNWMRSQESCLVKRTLTPGNEKMAELNKHQVLAIAIYVALKKSSKPRATDVNLQGPGFPLDLESEIFWASQTRDYWKLKHLLTPLLCDGPTDPDDYLVPLEVVFENIYCWLLRESIVVDRPPAYMKWVKMSQWGENTMFPVKHCRCCGMLTAKEFRLCSLCEECPEYHDRNYFCSEECEEMLKVQHTEEHARFFMVKLNMD